MSRWLYSLLWHLLLPLIPLRLVWRSIKQPAYRHHVAERFGFYPAVTDVRPCLWLHAVSVGEMRAAMPLVYALQQRYADHALLLTCMTPTGRDTALQVYGDDVRIVYLPYDLPWAVRRFMKHYRPQIGVFMETELWPNLIAACRRAEVPLLLANARLSQRSAQGYERVRAVIAPAIASINHIAAQSSDDAQRLRSLGARSLSVCGNTKFDIEPPTAMLERGQAFRARIGAGRRVVLCASTREGEEALLLEHLPQPWPADWLWLIVPRHPQRFDDVAEQVAARGLTVQRRSDELDVGANTQVWIGDSMGEMFAYYTACDLAFIGGSLLPFGAQNLIEPAAVGRPVLIGPSTFNFAEATRLAVEAGAAEIVDDAEAFWKRVAELLQDAPERARRGEAGLAFCAQHRGATQRIMYEVKRLMQRQD